MKLTLSSLDDLSARVEEARADGVAFTPAGGTSRLHRADSVVVVGTAQPDLTQHAAIAAALPDVPVTAVGDPCLGGGTGATYTSVEQTGQEAGGLVAHHDGASRVLVEQPAG